MKIISIKSRLIHYVEFEGESYVRFSADNWMVVMGESLESVMDCKDIEKAFHDYNINQFDCLPNNPHC